jgi:hypothetical protein
MRFENGSPLYVCTTSASFSFIDFYAQVLIGWGGGGVMGGCGDGLVGAGGFVNNCIGHGNHKSFVCFLVWTLVSTGVMCAALLSSQRSHLVWRNGLIMFRGLPWSAVAQVTTHSLPFPSLPCL